ncbi:MAG: hypothetical protein K2X86_18035 [Cytophagaceae bacterium]|nr:hypothetical protein [Cytophagaceae bacterium]
MKISFLLLPQPIIPIPEGILYHSDNWQSEMHETFSFWSFEEWKQHVQRAGFDISPQSVAFSNPWIVENRFENKAELYRMTNGKLIKMSYPVTNMFLICEKKI